MSVSPPLPIFWLACVGVLIATVVAIPFAFASMMEGQRLAEDDPEVREAKAAWQNGKHKSSEAMSAAFDRYWEARNLAGLNLTPSLRVRNDLYMGLLLLALLAFVVELIAFGFMLARRNLRVNRRWFTVSWLGIYAVLAGVVLLAVVSGPMGEMNRAAGGPTPLGLALFALPAAAILFGIHSLFASSVSLCVILFKLWGQVQDEYARATPGEALGKLFIPLYNLYWMFVAFPGLADELNQCAARRSLDVRPASRGLMITYCVLCFVIMVPYLGILAALANVAIGVLAFRSAARVGIALEEARTADEQAQDPVRPHTLYR